MSSMSMGVRIRLSIMMFLQYMMFAVWWVQLAGYLGQIRGHGELAILDSRRHAPGLRGGPRSSA